MKPRLVLLLIFARIVLAQPTWVEKTSTAQTCSPACVTQMPGVKAWFQEGSMYDPVSQSVLFNIGVHGSSGIYATDVYAYQTTANKFIHIVGTGNLTDTCNADTSTQPTDRHPEQMAIDTQRGVLWLLGGANATCGHALPDQYYLTLNSNPALDTWTEITPVGTYPVTPGVYESTVVYDSDHDMLLMWGADLGGFGKMYRYCSTMPVGGGTPSGTLSGTQTTAGCTVADGWTLDTTSGSSPAETLFPGMVYAPNVHKAIIYAGASGACPGSGCIQSNLTYLYDPTTKAWTAPAPASPPPTYCYLGGSATCTSGPYGQAACCVNPPVVYNPATGHMMYHQDTNTGAPADWEYDPVGNTWTRTATGIALNGGTNIGWTNLGLDPSTNTLIGFEETDTGNLPRIWQGALPGGVTVSVPVTVQEAIYTGSTAGVTRTNEVATFSVPFADADAIPSSANTLTVNAAAGQFRCIAQWPSTNCKWAQVDTIVSFAAGASAALTVTNGSTGNFGGSNICTDPGGATAITCATGTATFTVKKANFNGLDTALVGATSIVATSNSANRAFLILGPANPGTSCGTCTTVFSSANDASSTSVIEENGPVRAVVKSVANLTDGSNNIYMHITVRQYFYLNQTRVRTVTVLRNADYGTSSTFATAFKGHQGFEYRISPSITGTLTATIANETGSPTTATLSQSGGTDSAYIYVGETQTMNEPNWCSQDESGHQVCIPRTNDIGYSIVNNGTTLRGGSSVVTAISAANPAVITLTGSPLLSSLTVGSYVRLTGVAGTGCTGLNTPAYAFKVSPGPNQPNYLWKVTNITGQNVTITFDATGCTYTASTGTAWSDTQYPQGWADISDSGGKGMSIGVYQLAGYGAKSLEFRGGGTDVRIGIWAAENSQPYYATWPGWEISDQYLDFHATAPASLPNNFLRYQHYLLGRAAIARYNSTSVFRYPLEDPIEMDTEMVTAQQAESIVPPALTPSRACCLYDKGLAVVNTYNLARYYYYSWSIGSGSNQADLRWGDISAWLTRGTHTGCLSGSTVNTCNADPLGSHFAGRYLDASHFYRFIAETGWPHADGFTWRSKVGEQDACGQPSATSLNSNPDGLGDIQGAMQLWKYCRDMQEHYHVEGIVDYYHLTGDETIKESIVGFPTGASGGLKDLFLNTVTSQTYGWLGNASGKNGTHAATTTNTVTLGGGESFNNGLVAGGYILSSQLVGTPIAVGTGVYTVTAVNSTTNLSVTPDPGTNAGPLGWAYDGGLFNTRAVGAFLTLSARLATFLSEIGDTDAATVLSAGERLYKIQVKPDLCVAGGGPAGCTPGPLSYSSAPGASQGVSRVRGFHFGNAGASFQTNCSATTGPVDHGRGWSLLFNNNLAQGLWELLNAEGTSWPEYWTALDLVYGVSQAMLNEGYAYDGTNHWYNYSVPFNSNGFRFAIFSDWPNTCDTDQQGYQGNAAQTVWFPFYLQSKLLGTFAGTVNETKWNMALQWEFAQSSVVWSDYGGYQLGYAVNALKHPSGLTLQSLAPSVVDHADGTYTVSWTTPAGATQTRVKYGCLTSNCADGAKQIVELIGFDSGSNAFIGNPATTINWFAAQNASSIPAPVTGSQSMTVTAGISGLLAPNFSVKVMAPLVAGEGSVTSGSGVMSGKSVRQ